MFRPSASRTFNGRINVAFVNIRSYNYVLQQTPEPTPGRHTIFAFLITALFNFLQLQYQSAGTVSPFQTHPKTMSVALFSLLLYCIAYEGDVALRNLCVLELDPSENRSSCLFQQGRPSPTVTSACGCCSFSAARKVKDMGEF
ncbi:hypothetical protein RHGRI_020235 [Rhododendron griersonianum]|uniref:Uncharacterized protein n=1 Tax=Rhododendron griersonianum TaxID=479676 RepID=A0AAV6JIY0_9ERIC|nr:hypothetical protein RHGRI_020235 [Rhododendron griersonianum]